MNKDLAIYIHIPFCINKCYYCDFISFDNKDELISNYIDSLCNEILSYSDILSECNITSIYIGGGTPSYIDSKYISKILSILNLFVTNNDIEKTIEINPNSITLDKIKDYISNGINRFSIGLQSTHDEVLKLIGRSHNYNDFLNTLKILKECNVSNISLDLIYPLPNLNLSLLDKSIDSILDLSKENNIKHISVYNLEVHENTKLHFLLKENFLNLVSEDEEYEMKNLINSKLEDNNFNRYEISNYAIKGYESKHNLNYWKQGMYLGFGVAASSFFNNTRYTNTNDINKYIDFNLNNNSSISIKEEVIDLDDYDIIKENIILALRLKEGINIQEFNNKFKIDILKQFKNEIDKCIHKGLLEIENNIILRLTNKGFDFANIVWQEFV
jgi:oxygen-independent coproporphyrinogen III oxidase